jgi:hypothetical protein
MLGWDIYISRQRDGGSAPATFEAETGATLESWDSGMWGLRWAGDLTKAGEAIDLGGNGYPMRYTAQAKVLRHSRAIPLRQVWNQAPVALAGASPPVPKKPSLFDCPPDEWLVIETWDQS